MYSLGVIFFEMCYPLRTGMERDRVLRVLREKPPTLPADFNSTEKAVQAEIIQSLVSHRPADRPSTDELLHGGKLPVQIEDETFRQALQGLSDSNSPYFTKMLSALFSQPVKQAKDFAWDMDTKDDVEPNKLLLQGIVKDSLISVFRRHGAVETTRPLLFPKSKHYSNANIVQLLDSSGSVIQLPYDLTLPHARLLAKTTPSALKTFAFGHVYRDLHTGGQPQGHAEVDFDLVSYDTLDFALKEAEVLKVIDEVIDSFPSLRLEHMCYHINHSDMLDLILSFCRIAAPLWPAVKDSLSKLNIAQWTWQKIRNELRAPAIGISSTSLDDLARFDFRGEQLRRPDCSERSV
jgi:translation initiation factor 2-alpha kinase 4